MKEGGFTGTSQVVSTSIDIFLVHLCWLHGLMASRISWKFLLVNRGRRTYCVSCNVADYCANF